MQGRGQKAPPAAKILLANGIAEQLGLHGHAKVCKFADYRATLKAKIVSWCSERNFMVAPFLTIYALVCTGETRFGDYGEDCILIGETENMHARSNHLEESRRS